MAFLVTVTSSLLLAPVAPALAREAREAGLRREHRKQDDAKDAADIR